MSSTTTESAPAKPKASAPKVEEGVSVAALVDALKGEGVVAKPKWNPKRTYARLLVGGKNVAYVDAPNRNGMKVTPAIAHAELKNGAQKLFAPSKAGGQFGAVAMVTDLKQLAVAASAVAAADAKRQAKASS